ncbi:MAG: hydroxyethylthiazole kinase, partial [Desulfatitalea sp.]|nr:hydroxyethylthiazole kinase [Desulfatitalea sp.]
EILSLESTQTKIKTKGVDSSLGLTESGVEAAMRLAREKRCIVAVSGAEDCISDGRRVYCVGNGQALMTKGTGIGCGLSAVTAAFCARGGGEYLRATTAAFAFYGLCADLAIRESNKPGSFYTAFLDRLYDTGAEEIQKGLKIAFSENG